MRLRPEDWPEALADTDGRQLVVAGPGTGKTEFLVRRVTYLLEHGAARPEEIVVLSFSRRASARLGRRIDDARGGAGVPVDVGTFHSLALRLIEAATGGHRPIPLTTPEQVGLVREVLAGEDPAVWPLVFRGILGTAAFSAEVADFLLRCSERLLTPDDLVERARERADWRGLPGLYSRYLQRLADMGRTDYGVLLGQAVDLLRSRRGDTVATDHRYVIVDEYQDTTPAQAEMAGLLAADHGNLTVAGDPYQSIFSFRGAEVANIAAFSEVPGTRRIVLGKSFRVPAEVMDAALRVVSGGELPGSAGAVEPAGHGGVCETYVFDQETAEAEWIAREVERMVRVEGLAPSRIAVVVRSKKELLSELSRALDRRGLPHDPPDSRLVDHPAIRIFQDLVTVAVRGQDADGVDRAEVDGAMRRLLLGPLVGIGIGQEREMLRRRDRGSYRWGEVVSSELPHLRGLAGLLTDPPWASDAGAADGFWEAWTRLDGIPEMVADPARDEWRRAWTAFGQMLGRQADRDPTMTLSRFFELVEEDDFEPTPLISHRLADDRVVLTTLHQVKGLEFDAVFIANAVEGVFPDLRRSRRMLRPELLSPERTVDPEAQHLFQLQEEMRLAYTAMTRARRRVTWTATQAGVDQGEHRPSRFLLAAAGDHPPRPPEAIERDPLTVPEAEIALRRDLLDVAAGPARRLSALQVLATPQRPWWDPGSFAGAPRPGPDRPVHGGRFRLSPSQAEAYLSCPRRYVLERRLRLGDSSSVYAHFGDLIHEVLETAEGEVIGTGERHARLDRVVQILDDVWARADFGPAPLNRAWKDKAVEMLTKLYDNWPGKGKPVGVEVQVEGEVDGVRWIGRVDRVERGPDGLRVVDYKTGASAPTVDEGVQSIQLAFYAMAVAASQGETVSAAEMWFPRVKSKSVTTRALALHKIEEIEETMRSITTAVAAEDWEPKVSAACGRCAFRRSCPAWPEGRGAFLP